MGKKKPTTEPTPPLRLEWRSPAELAENPANWRRHPQPQLSALTDAIAEVGWAGACLFNERTGRLIDGHARRKVALEQGTAKVPVLVGDWSEEQEKKILATLDPLAAMAEADKAALDALLRDVQTGSEALAGMLTELAEQNGIVNITTGTDTLPDLSDKDSHVVSLKYTLEDEPLLKTFVGQKDDNPLEPQFTGKKILERIKEIAAAESDPK